jgi:hypothetical protein
MVVPGPHELEEACFGRLVARWSEDRHRSRFLTLAYGYLERPS